MCIHTVLLEKGTCDDCDYNRRTKLNVDARCGDNMLQSRKDRIRIVRWARGRGEFTADDLYSDPVLKLEDISMYLALHRMVQDGDLTGPDPYAPGAPPFHSQMVYVWSRPLPPGMMQAADGGL